MGVSAIYGDGFCVSGKRAFRVLTQNAIKVATINSVGDFVMALGRFLITGLSVLIGYLLLQVGLRVTCIYLRNRIFLEWFSNAIEFI